MTPDEYEELVAAVLRDEGWKATVTPSGRDHGLDVIAERDGMRLGVQAKMWRQANRPVNAATVMLTYGAAAYADCPQCMVATDGRILADAEQVAAKLGVAIRVIPTTQFGSQTREARDTDPLNFSRVWTDHVVPLAGTTLRRRNGRTNEILAVDSGGVVRRTSNGKEQRIDIDVFRWTIERLLAGETVLREDINAQCVGRASSGVVLILSAVPLFESATVNGKQGLRLHGQPGPGAV